MIVILWKNTYSYKRHTHRTVRSWQKTPSYSSRNHRDSRVFQTLTIHIHLQILTIHRLTNTYIQIKTLKLILVFKITCILRSSQTGTDAGKKEDEAYSRLIFHFDLCFSVYQNLIEYNCIIIILLMQWMMLLLVYYFTLLLILYMTSSAPERFRCSWFWGVTD